MNFQLCSMDQELYRSQNPLLGFQDILKISQKFSCSYELEVSSKTQPELSKGSLLPALPPVKYEVTAE